MKITEFRLSEERRGMWEHQNGAVHTGSFVEGVCNDSYVLACKRGYCFVYSRAKAGGWVAWQDYKFAPYKDVEAVRELWREWEEFERYMTYTRWDNLGAEGVYAEEFFFDGCHKIYIADRRMTAMKKEAIGGRGSFDGEKFTVECKHGKLVAGFFGDPGEYDGIYIDLVKPDGEQTQCCIVETTPQGKLHALVWDGGGDAATFDHEIDPDGSNVY